MSLSPWAGKSIAQSWQSWDHVFQGRFKAILVEKDAYLMELARYVVLNPLRAKMQELVDKLPAAPDVPCAQRRALVRALADYASKHERNEGIALAYLSGQHTMASIARHFGVHYTTVSRLVKAHETAQKDGVR